MLPQNLHTHSLFCDGKNSVEEMIQAAIKQGLGSIGFSSHSPLPFPCHWAMKEDPALYRAEVLKQKARYADRIPVYLGLEQDFFSPEPGYPYDYLIGSVHYMKKDGKIYSVDHAGEVLQDMARECFGGDMMAVAEHYYRMEAGVADQTKCRIVGHFDLITRYNEGNRFFDAEDPRYLRAALEALDALRGRDLIFEINTGPVGKGNRSEPYPDLRILKQMREWNLPILFSADSHKTDTLTCCFDMAAERAKACGYREIMYFNGRDFEPGPMPELR